MDRILEAGRRAPSAGFSQGLELLVLDTPETIAEFWAITRDDEFPWEDEDIAVGPTVLVLPLPDKRAIHRALLGGRQDRVRHGRGGSMARPLLGYRRRDGRRC